MTESVHPPDFNNADSPAGTEDGAGGVAYARQHGVNTKLLRVALTFIVVFLILDGVLLWSTNTMTFYRFRVATARTATALIRLSGIEVRTSETDIYCSTRRLRIDSDCTGLLVVAAYMALIVAYPISWKTKGVGLLVGVPGVLFANQVRLVAVAHASERLGDQAFSFVHDYLFKVFMVAVVVGLWAWWLAYARRHAR